MSGSWVDAVTKRFYCPGQCDAMRASGDRPARLDARQVSGTPARTGYFLDEKETSRYD